MRPGFALITLIFTIITPIFAVPPIAPLATPRGLLYDHVLRVLVYKRYDRPIYNVLAMLCVFCHAVRYFVLPVYLM